VMYVFLPRTLFAGLESLGAAAEPAPTAYGPGLNNARALRSVAAALAAATSAKARIVPFSPEHAGRFGLLPAALAINGGRPQSSLGAANLVEAPAAEALAQLGSVHTGDLGLEGGGGSGGGLLGGGFIAPAAASLLTQVRVYTLYPPPAPVRVRAASCERNTWNGGGGEGQY
jgi:hypothetical protein